MQPACDIFSYRKYWARRLTPAPVLPMSRAEMDAIGWDECDVILVTGETVNRQSFRATLNQQDVTNLFVTDTTYGGDLVAQFNFQNSSLPVGRNVLITSVDGTIPDTTRTASDVDRVTFDVQN